MNPKTQRGIRTAAQELLDIETSAVRLGKQAGAARVKLSSLLPPPKRDEPDPPKRDRPANDVVTVRVEGDSYAARVEDGGAHPFKRRGSDLAIVVTRKGDQYDVMLANAFEGVGTITVESFEVTWPDGRRSYGGQAITILPGHCFLESSEYDGPMGSGSDLHSVAAWHDAMMGWNGGFSVADGRKLYGPADANHGNGSLIYPWIGHWADGPLGTRMAYEVMRGYAHRQPIFRWDREAFEQGRIEAWKPGEDFEGVDRTATYAPTDYRLTEEYKPGVNLFTFPKVAGKYDALDHQHLGRIGHVTAHCAKLGYPLAKIILNALAEDVRLSWCYDLGRGKKQVEGSESPNSTWWTCHDVLNYWPKHQGCSFMGREFGQAMMLMANAVMYADGDQADLGLMLRALAHVYDRRNKCVSTLTFLHPLFGYESTKYKQKIEETNSSIPDGAYPSVVKTFEEGILLCGLMVAADATTARDWAAGKYMSIGVGLRESIRTHDSKLRVIGKEAWSDPKQQVWSPMILGIPKVRFGEDDVDLKAIVESTSPRDSSNPAAAFSGEWSAL